MNDDTPIPPTLPPEPSSPLFSEPITKYLDRVIGWKEKSVVGGRSDEEKHYLQNLAQEQYKPYVHIQEPGELDNTSELFYVWRMKDWLRHSAVIIAKNDQANIERVANEIRREKITKLCKDIKIQLNYLSDEMIKGMATKIVEEKNYDAAREFLYEGEL